ncbi:MAG: hypothetical protein QM778_27660 [Myxococcales bacterium]
MRQRLVFLGTLVVLWFSFTSGHAQDGGRLDPGKQVQRDVSAILHSLYRGEVEVVLRYTHPAIVQMLGGPDKARRALNDGAAQMAKAEMKIESLSFPRSPEFFDGGQRRFVFVPTLLIIVAKGARIESLNFQLGILEPGKTDWKYVEGSRVTPENAQALFPGFPKERALPPFYRKRI